MNKSEVPILEVNDLSVEDGERSVLKIGRFQFHRGVVYAIVGGGGAGKTVLCDVLAGRRAPTSGKVTYESEEHKRNWLGKVKPSKDILFLGQAPMAARVEVASMVASRLGAEVAERVRQQYFSGTREAQVWKSSIEHLSRGQRNRIEIILALESDPKVIIIDDFGSQLDQDQRRDLAGRLRAAARNRGTSIILSTTEAVYVQSIASIMVFLENGRISKVRSQKRGPNGPSM